MPKSKVVFTCVGGISERFSGSRARHGDLGAGNIWNVMPGAGMTERKKREKDREREKPRVSA